MKGSLDPGKDKLHYHFLPSVLSNTYSEPQSTTATDPVIYFYFILFNSGWSVCQNAAEKKLRQDKNCSIFDTIRRPLFLWCIYLPQTLVRCSHFLDMLLKLMS